MEPAARDEGGNEQRSRREGSEGSGGAREWAKQRVERGAAQNIDEEEVKWKTYRGEDKSDGKATERPEAAAAMYIVDGPPY